MDSNMNSKWARPRLAIRLLADGMVFHRARPLDGMGRLR